MGKNKPVKRDSFIFYKSFYDALKHLPESDQFLVLNSIMEYHFLGKEKSLSGIPSAIWHLIRPQLDSNNRKYINGLHPKNGSKTEAKGKQKVSKTEANVNVNENVNENVNVNETTKKYFFNGDNFNIDIKQSQLWLDKFKGYDERSLFEKLETIDSYYSGVDKKPKNIFFSVSSWIKKDEPPKPMKFNQDDIVLW